MHVFTLGFYIIDVRRIRIVVFRPVCMQVQGIFRLIAALLNRTRQPYNENFIRKFKM